MPEIAIDPDYFTFSRKNTLPGLLFTDEVLLAHIESVILYPEDDKKRNALVSYKVLDWFKSLPSEVRKGMVDEFGFDNYYDLVNLFLDNPEVLQDSNKRLNSIINSVGHVFAMHYFLSKFAISNPSVRKSIYIVSELKGVVNESNPNSRVAATEQGLRNFWKTHKNISYLCSAVILCRPFHRIRETNADPKRIFKDLFSASEFFRIYGESIVEPRTNQKLLNSATSWYVSKTHNIVPREPSAGEFFFNGSCSSDSQSDELAKRLIERIVDNYSKRNF